MLLRLLYSACYHGITVVESKREVDMPTSANRRRVELPAALFARLEERARRDGQTIAGLVATLLAGALDAPGGGVQGERGGDREVIALLQQVIHNNGMLWRELQLVQQRLDLVLRVLVEGQGDAEGEASEASAASRTARQRLLEELSESYVPAPLPPVSTLAQSGELRPIQSRTLWQRPLGTPKREAAEEREE
jgi:hypothetical protein